MNKYVRIEEGLARSKEYSSTEKLFLSLMFALTGKGTRGTRASQRKIALMIGCSSVHVSKMFKKFSKYFVTDTDKYGDRVVKLHGGYKQEMIKLGYMTPKREKKAKEDNEK